MQIPMPDIPKLIEQARSLYTEWQALAKIPARQALAKRIQIETQCRQLVFSLVTTPEQAKTEALGPNDCPNCGSLLIIDNNCPEVYKCLNCGGAYKKTSSQNWITYKTPHPNPNA